MNASFAPSLPPTESRIAASTLPKARHFSDLVFLLQTSRPGFWITSIWFYLLPLAQAPVWESFRFWLGLFFITFPLGLLIYGCNDLVDAESDRFNPRKGTFLFGARGTAAQRQTLPAWIITVHAIFLLVLWRLEGFRMVLWYAGLVIATVLNNWPKPGLKNRPFFDMLNQTAYLLVFALASMLNHLPSLPWPSLLFGALFAMHSHLLGQIMDVEPDGLAGRKSTALALGVVRAKLLVALFMFSECLVVALFLGEYGIAAALVGGALWFILDAFLLFRSRVYPNWVARMFLNAWNVMALATAWWIWSTGAFSKIGR